MLLFSPIVNHQATNMVPHNKRKVTSDCCGVKSSSEYFICNNPFNPQNNPARKVREYPHFAEEETEVMTSPKDPQQRSVKPSFCLQFLTCSSRFPMIGVQIICSSLHSARCFWKSFGQIHTQEPCAHEGRRELTYGFLSHAYVGDSLA